jgi:ferredoxin
MEVDASSIVVGTCEDMCPAKERIKRQEESDVHQLELPQNGQTLQQTMIKKFQRSSADHELQIADAMRTPAALLRTIQYIENHIMIDDDDPLRTYLFIWDRYRMIAKDFTLQASVLPATRTWIECHERMVRWFVFMDHAMQVNGKCIQCHSLPFRLFTFIYLFICFQFFFLPFRNNKYL